MIEFDEVKKKSVILQKDVIRIDIEHDVIVVPCWTPIDEVKKLITLYEKGFKND